MTCFKKGKKFIFRVIVKNPLIRFFVDRNEHKLNSEADTLLYEQSEKGWSFVIVTDGKSDTYLTTQLASIYENFLGKDNFEIIIVGSTKISLKNNCKLIPYKDIKNFPGYITLKKNIGVRNAKFDKVVITHDYVCLDKDWLKGFENISDDFDICVTKVNLKDGRRTRDWMVWDYPNIGQALLPYEIKESSYNYFNGTYIICNRDFFLQNPFNEHLRWGEAEDVEWSLRVRNNAKIILNTFSQVHYLKDKPASDAPYCKNWIENTEKIRKLLKVEYDY